MSRARAYANDRWEHAAGDPTIGPGSGQVAPGNHGHPQRDYFVAQSHDVITGGGDIRAGSQRNLYWSNRFIVIANGNNDLLSTTGHYNIDMPTSGAVATVGGAPARSWSTSGIVLNDGETLWYILPRPDQSQASIAVNFRLAGAATDFQPGNDWILVAAVNGDEIRVCNGMRLTFATPSTIGADTGWIAVTFQNGWYQYPDAYWEGCAYRRLNGMVHLKGLCISGTIQYNVPIFTLPYGFRPLTDMHLPGASQGQFCPINIGANGVVGQNKVIVQGGWLSLRVPPFPAAV